MKKLQLFLILAITFIACKQEGINPPQKGSVQFSLSKKLANSGGRVSSTVTPKVVLLSIEDAVGNSIELNKNLILYTFGAGFVSERHPPRESGRKAVVRRARSSREPIPWQSAAEPPQAEEAATSRT